MSVERIQATGLWKTAFSEENRANEGLACGRLSAALWKFRDNAEVLVSLIAKVLPDLTLHDISHLDALWGVADVIAGPDYPLNPLEAFVLGGSILLHDSAMCWEAFENGQAGVRATLEWKDAFAIESERDTNATAAQIESSADFSALRALHAHQAESLPSRGWQHPDSGQELYLIDDSTLRMHVGTLIGKIASSHHWDMERVESELGEQFNPPAWLPVEWRVDPVKIACLLRCADAAHVNHARAPDFMYALVRRAGVPKDHWRAQNMMMGPTIDDGDPSNETIMYTSSNPYPSTSASAWWVAFDAVSVIDGELRASNALLRKRGRKLSPEFLAKRVKGAGSVEDLARLLRAEKWTPCNARLHVSNIELLVKNLGGEKLYGAGIDKTEVVLRELIQNARDSIVARRHVDPGHEGSIAIKLQKIGAATWLVVEDDGVGMSYNVLTGTLLDFGTSFWKSALVQSEFPGLRSSGFRSVGRFGIGFYSVFMIADSVTVVSKRWDKGIYDTNSLVFSSGLTFRPLVQQGKAENFNTRASTQVRLKLVEGTVSEDEVVKVLSGRVDVPGLHPSLRDFLSVLVTGLDVRIFYESDLCPRTCVHDPAAMDTSVFLKKLSLAKYQNDRVTVESYIDGNHCRLRKLEIDGRILGVAALSTIVDTARYRLGLRTVGGLAASVHAGYAQEFIGYLNYTPGSAKRETDKIEAAPACLQNWYGEQLELLTASSFGDFERCVVASNACGLGFDPLPFGRLLLVRPTGQQIFLSYEQVAEMAATTPIVIFKSKAMDHAETYHRNAVHHEYPLIQPLVNSGYLSLEFNGDCPKSAYSIIGCLDRAVRLLNRIPKWTLRNSIHQGTFGSMDELLLNTVASG